MVKKDTTDSAKRIAYITSRTPWGSVEAFVLAEIVEHIRNGWDVHVYPIHCGTESIFHPKAAIALPNAHCWSWSGREMRRGVMNAIREQLWKSAAVGMKVARESAKNPRALLTNLALFPRALAIADDLRRRGVTHIHAHWASGPTTCAYIASKLTGVPYSFTSHAWDIFIADNMLEEKINSSSFSITSTAYNLRYIESHYPRADLSRIQVLNPGVSVPQHATYRANSDGERRIRIGCVGNLVEKKGHAYLLEALSKLRKNGYLFECLLIGDGPLRASLTKKAHALKLSEAVRFVGKIPHGQVLELLGSGKIDIFVLPSIVLIDGQREGLPFALMEAMSYGIPVVSTGTAGIPELIVDESTGLLVPEQDADRLAAALEELIRSTELRKRIGSAGRLRVQEEFNLHANAAKLRQLMRRKDPQVADE